jgi:hypothetical protein
MALLRLSSWVCMAAKRRQAQANETHATNKTTAASEAAKPVQLLMTFACYPEETAAGKNLRCATRDKFGIQRLKGLARRHAMLFEPGA